MTDTSLESTKSPITTRPFQSDDDYWRVRSLLIETYPLTPTGFNWEIRRWDGWRFHANDPAWNPEWARRIRLWETTDGRLVGVAHPEYRGDAQLELHPDYRYIEADMIAWSEAHLAETAPEGGRLLEIFVMAYDTPRRRLLEARGYEKTASTGFKRRLRFGSRALPPVEMAPGYILRATRDDDDDYRRVAGILNAGFNRTIHSAQEFATFARLSPSFRHDLNLVAEADDGQFAALVGITYDEVNRCGIFEPVCTHPDHRRRGLAQALMVEGLHRLKALGAADMVVDTGDARAANELYDSVGFTEAYQGNIWRKRL